MPSRRAPVSLRQLILVTHRWLGLSTSVVLAIVGVTGSILLWQSTSVIRRAAGPLHQELALGAIGWWIVVLATLAGVFLEAGGLVLWWKRKTIAVRTGSGWLAGLNDLHHVAGVIGLVFMLMLAVTGFLMAFVTPQNQPQLRGVLMDLHTARRYSGVVIWVYAIGSSAFLLQGVTGVIMWWKPAVRRRT